MASIAPPPVLRDRRRAETVAEIKDAALHQLARSGGSGLSLRAVAREVGVSVQALYHYFDSRDALVTALVTDTFTALADAVRDAAPASLGQRERVVAAGLAYRRWAVEHPSAFLLALGAPLPDYTAPEDGPTSAAAGRMSAAFREADFGGWSAAALEAVPLPTGGEALEEQLRTSPAASATLPPGALALFLTGWSTLHGVVLLELVGHLRWTGAHGEELCRAALLPHAEHLERLREAAAG